MKNSVTERFRDLAKGLQVVRTGPVNAQDY